MNKIKVNVTSVTQLTPSIKRLTFSTNQQTFSFLAGQWLDLYVNINGEEKIGGYSFTSSANQKDEFELTIKYSERHPVTKWIHEEAKVGSEVIVDGGYGKCVWKPEMTNLTLFAGGIGITPLISIIRTALESDKTKKIHLIYSNKNMAECAFYSEIEELKNNDSRLKIDYVATQKKSPLATIQGRLSANDIEKLKVDPDSNCFLCGPPKMIDELEANLKEKGFKNIHLERWW